AYLARGDQDNERDNKALITQIVALRAEKAALLGFETYAHVVLDDRMAKNPAAVEERLDSVWPSAVARANEEAADLAAMKKADGFKDPLTGGDWRHYSERVKKERFDIDDEALRPYFEVHAVRDGAFSVAQKLFGLEFEEKVDLPRWHPDQEVFEVKDSDGSHIGILYLDFYTRESKRGGAWMASLRPQSELLDETPVVTVNCNFPPPTAGAPSLLSFDEASTLFHEFGHAVHGLLSDVTYPSVAGTRVPRDFVEFPSQVMENWMSEPEVLQMFARHVETGEPIPEELITKLQASKKFNQGFAVVEYMAAAYLDLRWHTLKQADSQISDVRAFEEATLNEIGLPDLIPPRYRSTYFRHIFSGGYAAGYYSYQWSEVLDADAFAAFQETSLFDADTAARYRALLSQGGSRPGMDLYREFRGRDPEIGALLTRLGFDQK
ncbi:MAG: M3 family metallopeptidase, partial [Proteobacteria bacterium]|nr:M3 family metallopeptidase [Pseudomonadota bacterium]